MENTKQAALQWVKDGKPCTYRYTEEQKQDVFLMKKL